MIIVYKYYFDPVYKNIDSIMPLVRYDREPLPSKVTLMNLRRRQLMGAPPARGAAAAPLTYLDAKP